MKKVLQQGQADGLCGIYAILNFLNRTHWKDWVDHGLWNLLDAARHFGWFTPQHLTDGFEDYQLKSILDLQFKNYRMEYSTYFLSDVVSAHRKMEFKTLLEHIVEQKGSAIVHKRIGDVGHWLLVTGEADGVIVCDSDNQKRPASPLSKRIGLTEWGVVILPCKRPKLRLEL